MRIDITSTNLKSFCPANNETTLTKEMLELISDFFQTESSRRCSPALHALITEKLTASLDGINYEKFMDCEK